MNGVPRYQGTLVAGTPPDPLAVLNDTFLGPGPVAAKWSLYKPASVTTLAQGGGYGSMLIAGGGPGANRSFWFDDNDGCQLYQLCTGNFIAEIFIEARNAANSGPPPLTNFNVAGLQARDPSGAPLPTGFNYVHIGPASNNTGAYQNECKSTVNSVSGFDYVPQATLGQWVQLTRIGQIWSCAYRLLLTDPWTPRTIYDRTANPLPSTIALGPMCYSSIAGSDLSCRFNNFTVRTP